MNLDELRTVQNTERQKDSLQHLRESFYQEVGEYIGSLEEERDRIAAECADPFASPEVGRLTDEIETAKDVVEAMYERRMGKLVKQASLAAAGMAADDEGLTTEEAALFEDLVVRIRENKHTVLEAIENGDTNRTGTDPGANQPADRAVESRSASNTSTSSEPNGPGGGPMSSSGRDGARSSTADGQTSASSRSDSADDSQPIPPDVPIGDGPEGESGVDANADSGSDGLATHDDDRSTPELDTGGRTGVDSPPEGEGGRQYTDGNRLGDSEVDSPVDGEGRNRDGKGATKSSDDSATADVDRVTVRITRDVGSFLGVDEREYTLSSDDVVNLPEQNAAPLLERDAAEPLE